MREQVAREIVDLITGAWRTQAVYTAVSLRLPDHVAAGSLTSAALATETGSSEDGLRRLMRLLVALGVFAGDDETGYRPTELSVALQTGAAGSMRDMCLLYGQEFYRAWGHAQEAISTSSPSFERACGRPLGDYLKHERGAGERFLRAMNAGNIFFEHLPAVFDFSGCSLVVDVGGGSGALLSAVLQANPMCAASSSISTTCCRSRRSTCARRRDSTAWSSWAQTSLSPCHRAATCTCCRACCRTGTTTAARSCWTTAGGRWGPRRGCCSSSA